MDLDPSLPPLALVIAWIIRETVPYIIRELKKRSHSTRPPPPLPRSEMPTPTGGFDRAGQSGGYAAVMPATEQYVTRGELAEFAAEVRDQYAALGKGLQDLARAVGHLEGVITGRPTRR